MGLLSALLTFPVSLPLKGAHFIAAKVAEQAQAEMLDESRIHQQLMELELRRDLGEIDDEEYTTAEGELLRQLDAIREYKEQQERESRG